MLRDKYWIMAAENKHIVAMKISDDGQLGWKFDTIFGQDQLKKELVDMNLRS